jgi:DNA-nicking Smr family endonuclease
LRDSVKGTVPLGATRPISTPAKKSIKKEELTSKAPRKKPQTPKLENLEYFPLSDFSPQPVTGDQAIQFTGGGISHKDMKRLKSGEFHVDGVLDLHGSTAEEARHQFLAFLEKAQSQGWRCVRIVHGKGKHGTDTPILKNLVNTWLRQLPSIIAFCSAPNRDGGTGAVYVLISRQSSENHP